MAELSSQTKKLIADYQLWQKSLQPKQGASTIHVDEVASKVAAFYEKLRELVDWKEEHLMRRAAIIRKLKRRFIDVDYKEAVQIENMAEPLILEMIRGGHFPNDRIEESKKQEVQKIINKYIFILKNQPKIKNQRENMQFYNWLIETAACEIEETLSPAIKENALINYMFALMKDRIRLNEGIITRNGMSEEEKNLQIYIAVQQALFKLDAPILSYNILKYKYPVWNSAKTEWLSSLPKNIYPMWKEVEKHLASPWNSKFYAICEKYDTPYLLLGDALSEENLQDVSEKISNPEILESLIKKAYNKRLSTLKNRLLRAAFYSTLSILLANILSILIIEIPLAKLLFGSFSPLAIAVDIFVPTILMFILTITIRPPAKRNLNVVLMESMKIVYKREKPDIYEIKLPRKRGFFTLFFITLVYVLGAIVTLSVVFLIFRLANLPPTSIVIHILLISLVAFAGLAIRKRAEELTVEETSGGFLGFIFDVLLLPVAGFGKWLSTKWKKYNAISAFFNALIDMPFLTFIEFLEKWRYYMKERKEEIH